MTEFLDLMGTVGGIMVVGAAGFYLLISVLDRVASKLFPTWN